MELEQTSDVRDTVRVKHEVRKLDPEDDEGEGSLVDPSKIKITIFDPENTKVVDGSDMSKIETGKYYYLWDTTDLDPGDYHVEVYVELYNAKAEDNFYVRLE